MFKEQKIAVMAEEWHEMRTEGRQAPGLVRIYSQGVWFNSKCTLEFLGIETKTKQSLKCFLDSNYVSFFKFID